MTIMTIIKYLGPAWFRAIAEEAEQAPATVAGIFFVWITIIFLAGGAYLTYTGDAEANEQRLVSLQTTVEAATREMACAKHDRVITAKAREIVNLQLLIKLTEDAGSVRLLEDDLEKLQRELRNQESAYKHRCL